jgi:hypothetical protein
MPAVDCTEDSRMVVDIGANSCRPLSGRPTNGNGAMISQVADFISAQRSRGNGHSVCSVLSSIWNKVLSNKIEFIFRCACFGACSVSYGTAA